MLKIHLKILEKKINLYLNLNLNQLWPPPITRLINLIHHMPTDNYSCATISSYISYINLSNKMHEHVVYTQSFVIQKLSAVVSKTNKWNVIRKLIAMSLLKQIIEALPNICSSYFESTLFASIFHYHYLAVLRIEKNSSIWNIRSYFRSWCNLYTLYAKHNQCNNEFIKNWWVWQIRNFANFKEYWRKHCPFQNIELFLKMRPKINGPLFIHLNYRVVTRFHNCSILKSALRFAGNNPGQYNTHSFRIGAAT